MARRVAGSPGRQVISLASAISACGRWEHSILLSEELGSSGLQANLMLSLTSTLLQTLLTLLEPLRNAQTGQTGSNNCGVRSKWPIRGYLQMLRSVHARNKVGPELCLSLSLSWYEFCVQNINNPVHRSVVAGYADVDCNTLARFAGVYHCHSNLLCPQCLSSCRIHHDTSHCVKKHATSASWAGGHHLKQCLDQFMRERRAVGAVLGAAETHQAGTSVDR